MGIELCRRSTRGNRCDRMHDSDAADRSLNCAHIVGETRTLRKKVVNGTWHDSQRLTASSGCMGFQDRSNEDPHNGTSRSSIERRTTHVGAVAGSIAFNRATTVDS